jgi:hypothetical protein
MNRQVLALFFYYAELAWNEGERMYELIINAQIKKGRFTLCYGIPICLWGLNDYGSVPPSEYSDGSLSNDFGGKENDLSEYS